LDASTIVRLDEFQLKQKVAYYQELLFFSFLSIDLKTLMTK
jgi:hypothetical protein